MRNCISLILFFLLVSVNAIENIPKSITLKSGNILLRLDGSKFWNINRIQYDDNLLSVDNPSAHYGMTYNPAGSKFFIGSGHKESGEGEVVKSLIIKVDNKKIDISRQISGKKITVEKISQIKELLVKYSFVLEENILLEKTIISSNKDHKIKTLYCFMHPWTTDFTSFYGISKEGTKINFNFVSNEKFPSRRFLPVGTFFNPKMKIVVATKIKLEKGFQNPQRLIWDRRFYRKDYFSDFNNKLFPKGHEAVYSCITSFAKCSNQEQWIAVAEKLIAKLNK